MFLFGTLIVLLIDSSIPYQYRLPSVTDYTSARNPTLYQQSWRIVKLAPTNASSRMNSDKLTRVHLLGCHSTALWVGLFSPGWQLRFQERSAFCDVVSCEVSLVQMLPVHSLENLKFLFLWRITTNNHGQVELSDGHVSTTTEDNLHVCLLVHLT